MEIIESSSLIGAVDKIYDLVSRPCVVIEDVRQACREARAIVRKGLELGNLSEERAALAKICLMLNSLDEKCAVDPVEVKEIAETALAKPPRNCDVGNAVEQSDRMRHFCLHDQGGCGVCSRRDGMTFRECIMDWGQMSYEKEGGS